MRDEILPTVTEKPASFTTVHAAGHIATTTLTEDWQQTEEFIQRAGERLAMREELNALAQADMRQVLFL